MQRKRSPKISIVVLHYGDLADTFQCLDSCKKINYPNYEIILVDNQNKEEEIKILQEKYSDIEIIKTGKNLGFGAANNLGIRKAQENQSQFVVCLNNDTVVDPEFLLPLLEVALAHPQIVVLGAVVFDYYQKKIVFTNANIDKKLKMKKRLDYINSKQNWWFSQGIDGCLVMMNLKEVQKYNLFFNEDLFLYCEEIDLYFRIKKLGLKMGVVKDSNVYHKDKKNKISPLFLYYNLRNRIIIALMHLSFVEKILFFLFFFFSRFLRILQFLFTKKFDLIRASFLAFKDGLKKRGGKYPYD